MAWIIAGLGNPGAEYEDTRHNTGRLAVEAFARESKFGEFRLDKTTKALVARGAVKKSLAALVLPETFMNKSGAAIGKFVKSAKAAERLAVVYDDLDLPLGSFKISFDRGSGGHKGIESVARAVKTKKFYRVRIGISPSNAGGALRKPSGEKVVLNYILDTWKPHELATLKAVFKKTSAALEILLTEGAAHAMNRFN